VVDAEVGAAGDLRAGDGSHDGAIPGPSPGAAGSTALALRAPRDVADVDGVRVLLGVGDDGVSAYVALLVEGAVEPWEAPDGTRWEGLREIGAALGDDEAALLVTAVALANWHATHPRCPRCGVPTQPSDAGWARRCPDDDSQHFPRSDPAVIVLVIDDDDRALLGRRAEWSDGWFSTLAGFVEAGESAEMALRREMREEAGVDVDRLDYLGSQPWPFPASLMLGYHARLAPGSPPARPDGDEITDLRWFTRDEMRAGCEAGTVRIPPRLSIARRLIERWYGAELPGSWSRP
jgi:NAD+ diphosphatase